MCFFDGMKRIRVLAILSSFLFIDLHVLAQPRHTLKGAVITSDGTMVPDFTVIVRPVARLPQLVLRKRFENGLFTIEGLAGHEYHVQVLANQHAPSLLALRFEFGANATQFRTIILRRIVEPSDAAVQSMTPATPENIQTPHPCQQGLELMSSGQLEEAIAYLGACLRTGPDRVSTLAHIGAIYLSLNRPDAALAYLKQAHKLDASNRSVRLNMALAYRDKGRLAEASQLLESLAAEPERNNQELYYLAAVYAAQGKYLPAERTIKQALDNDSAMLDGWLLMMDLALKRHDHETARHALRRLCDAMKNDSFTRFAEDQLTWMRSNSNP
jgi:tetratricopeptide (TPR) repeat protein